MEHITVNVKSLKDSVEFYTNVLGLKIVRDLRELTGRPIVFLADGDSSTKLELIENPDQPYSGAGLSIGFHRDDVEAAHAEMAAKGLAPSDFVTPSPSTKFFFITDPNGMRIQIIN